MVAEFVESPALAGVQVVGRLGKSPYMVRAEEIVGERDGAVQVIGSDEFRADVIPLPRPGEVVRVDVMGTMTDGVFLGYDPGTGVTGVLLGGEVSRLYLGCPDARTMVNPAVPASSDVAALQALWSLSNEIDQRKRWLDSLVESAHEWANDNDLCSRFDEFMEKWGLPTRTEEHSFEVTVTLTLTREARTWEDARDMIDESAIRDAICEGESFDYDLV